MTDERQIPSTKDLHWPILKALEDRGGSASIQELSEQVATDLTLTDELLDVPHKDGPQSEVDYRAAWARTNLKFVGRRVQKHERTQNLHQPERFG